MARTAESLTTRTLDAGAEAGSSAGLQAAR
jgi:hypothetical protein